MWLCVTCASDRSGGEFTENATFRARPSHLYLRQLHSIGTIIWNMWRSESLVRILSEVAYACCVIAFLSFFYNGSPFCGRLQVLKLALVVVALDSLASSFGWAFSWTLRSKRKVVVYAPVFSTLLVSGCLVYLPFWLFQGYGHFRFEYTSWNLRCVFEEGYVITFLAICAPVLAGMTFCREIGIEKVLRPKP